MPASPAGPDGPLKPGNPTDPCSPRGQAGDVNYLVFVSPNESDYSFSYSYYFKNMISQEEDNIIWTHHSSVSFSTHNTSVWRSPLAPFSPSEPCSPGEETDDHTLLRVLHSQTHRRGGGNKVTCVFELFCIFNNHSPSLGWILVLARTTREHSNTKNKRDKRDNTITTICFYERDDSMKTTSRVWDSQSPGHCAISRDSEPIRLHTLNTVKHKT